jgi:serine/threonine protein kinase
VEIYSGYLLPSQLPVAIKELTSVSFPVLNTAIQESLGMARLAHPAVLKIYDCTIETVHPAGFKAVIVTELMESDIEKEFRRRKRDQNPWTDMQLMAILGSLVSALSLAQSLEIAHRDIKPQNLFSSADSSIVKIGDFGSCLNNISNRRGDSRIVGSPLYLSPQLKAAHCQSIFSPLTQPISCNHYKSDVYSLGATMLAMARLEVPLELMGLEGLWGKTEGVLQGLRGFGVLAGWLRWMLAVEEGDRPDFVELHKHLRLQGYIREGQAQEIQNTYANVQQYPQYTPPVRPATAYQHPQSIPAIAPSPARYEMYVNPVYLPSLPQHTNSPLPVNAFVSVPSPSQLPVSAGPVFSKYERCIGCNGPIAMQMTPVLLNCGHKFHNNDCFFQHLERQSQHFLQDINLSCPLCQVPNDKNYTLVKAFGKGVFEQKQETAKWMMCCYCGCKTGLVTMVCTHKLCSAHSGRPYCLYCKRASPVQRNPAQRA